MIQTMRRVFVTGGTGYVGSRLIGALLARGHRIHALTRETSRARLPPGCQQVIGDALDAATFASAIPPAETLVHLVGVPHPSPAKARQFVEVDLAAARASAAALADSGVRHVVFVSVAQPAPVMKAYQAARGQAEAVFHETGVPLTIIRPWYVLGPGHWWPYVLLPAYAIAERLPSTRESARRLGLVTIRQMIDSLVYAVEHPTAARRVVEVPAIRRGGV